jgi:exodeoxyribonuclease V
MQQANKSILDHLHFHCPTSEQKAALIALQQFVNEENKDDFFILCGAAGTGKTSITSALIDYLNETETQYKISAPTGRAARILGKKTKAISSTIHSLIYSTGTNKNTGEIVFTLKHNTNSKFCIYIIDEASMIAASKTKPERELFQTNDSLLNHLAKYIKAGNTNNKIIFLGDVNQLPPIHENESKALNPNYLRNHYQWKGSFHYLTEVKRQEDGSYILKNANKLRKAIDDKEQIQPQINAYRHYNTFIAAKEYAKRFEVNNPDHAVAIGLSHRANNIFNAEVRKHLFGGTVELIVPGDLMIVMQNWKRGGSVLYNGDHVIVEEVCLDRIEEVANLHFAPVRISIRNLEGDEQLVEDYLLLDILLNETPQLLPDQEKLLRAERFRKNKIFSDSGKPEDDRYVGALRLAYGYAITCHKAQGGEWDKVYVNTFGVKDMRWTYTAITRAKQDLELY